MCKGVIGKSSLKNINTLMYISVNYYSNNFYLLIRLIIVIMSPESSKKGGSSFNQNKSSTVDSDMTSVAFGEKSNTC